MGVEGREPVWLFLYHHQFFSKLNCAYKRECWEWAPELVMTPQIYIHYEFLSKQPSRHDLPPSSKKENVTGFASYCKSNTC